MSYLPKSALPGLSGGGTIALTGDVTGSGAGSFSATLATVNLNTGTFGGAATVAQISVNGKGLVTGVSAVGIAAPWGDITGKPAAVTALSGTNTGDQTAITGNAGTASALQTARNINGVAFDGTASITINAVDTTARVPETRTLTTTAPLTGGGDLSASRTLAISAATTAAAGSMSAADKTKLDGVATGATANSSDATLLARANHTGAQAQSTVTNLTADLALKAPLASPAFTGTATFAAITATGSITSTGGLIGYGAGGVVTQATSKATAVTLNKPTGEITLNAAALAAGAIVTFTLNNSFVAVGDMILTAHHSGGTVGPYLINARVTGAGVASIAVRNTSAASLSEAIVVKFFVLKSTNA